MDERVSNIAKAYDNIDAAKRYYDSNKSKNFRGVISHKQILCVFSNLDYDFFGEKPAALDVGCNSGRYVKELVDRGFNATGIDTAGIPLEYASKRIDARFIKASATDMPLKQKSFDLVICMELLHHFEDEVLERVLREISRVMKPGGLFIFDVKNKMNPVLWYKYKREDSVGFTLKARTNRQMKKLVEGYGLRVINKKGIFFPFTLFAPYVIFFAQKEIL